MNGRHRPPQRLHGEWVRLERLWDSLQAHNATVTRVDLHGLTPADITALCTIEARRLRALAER